MTMMRNCHGIKISGDRQVRLIKSLEVTDLAGEKVMIDFGSGKYFLLKGPANEIWDMLANADEISVGEIVSRLMDMFEVDEETCRKSVVEFIQQMEKYEFVSIGE